jgi:hypothetical protein
LIANPVCNPDAWNVVHPVKPKLNTSTIASIPNIKPFFAILTSNGFWQNL